MMLFRLFRLFQLFLLFQLFRRYRLLRIGVRTQRLLLLCCVRTAAKILLILFGSTRFLLTSSLQYTCTGSALLT